MPVPEDPQHLVNSKTPRNRVNWIAPLCTSLICLAVYLVTLAPTVTSEDSGELIAAAHCFGIAHPPGYPLWTMLCGTFIKIVPFGSIAWRANLFSAACAALAIGLLCNCVMLLSVRPWIAASSSMVAAYGLNFWSQSVITEVYALNALIFAALLYSMMRWRTSPAARWLWVASLLVGLGLANHHLLGLSAAGMSLWALVCRPSLLRQWKTVTVCVCLLCMGLLPYAYLPLRARAQPAMNWGNPATPQEFWHHVTRGQYEGPSAPDEPQAQRSLRETLRQLGVMAGYAFREPTPALFILAMAGMIPLLRRHACIVLLLGVLTLAHTALFLCFHGIGKERDDLWASKVFFLPQYMLTALPLAVGLEWAFGRFAGLAVSWSNRVRRSCLCAANAAFALLGVVPLLSHWRTNDYHNYWYAYDHAVNLLNSALPNALIIPSGDHNTFPLIYLTQVEAQRPDVLLADKYGYIDPQLYRDMPVPDGTRLHPADHRPLIEEWVIRHARRPVYYTVRPDNPGVEAHVVNVGLLYHLLPLSKTIDTDAPWPHIQYRNLDEGMPCARDFGADNILADYEFFRGIHALRAGDEPGALKHFARACDYGADIKEVYNNVGCALAEAGLTDQALEYLARAVSIAPGYGVPRWNRLKVLKTRKAWEAAETELLELAKETPKDFRVFGELGFMAQIRNLPVDTAKARFLESLRLNPAQPQVIQALASIYESDRASGFDPTVPAESGAADPSRRSSDTPIHGTKPPQVTAHDLIPAGEHEPGDDRVSAETTTPLDAPSLAAANYPLEFTTLEWDFGELDAGAAARHTFTFQNIGEHAVRITDVLSTCSCAVPSMDQREYASGETGKVTVVFSADKPGRGVKAQRVTLLTDDPAQASIALDLRAEVRADGGGRSARPVIEGSDAPRP